ncbi:MAG TPA: zinc-ribbon domain-containing protein [Gemmataceae bacterium]|nr:zinc-ribbon domain-containing protein [Gemmataceae bacterium]
MPEQIRCPECSATLRVPETLLGKKVKCPKCQTTFTAEMDAPAEPDEGIVNEPAPSASRRRPSPQEEVEDEPPYEDEEDEDRPRRRGRRGGRRSAVAASMVAGPAISLMVVAGLAIALGLLGLMLNLLGTGMMAAGGQAKQGDVALNAVTGIGSSIFALCYWSLVMVGAIKMKNLSSYGLAMTACIVAMLPCSACCLLGLPFGIWGLVVINNPDVKNAFS